MIQKPTRGSKKQKNLRKKSHKAAKHIGCECGYCMHGWYQWLKYKLTGQTKRQRKYKNIAGY